MSGNPDFILTVPLNREKTTAEKLMYIVYFLTRQKDKIVQTMTDIITPQVVITCQMCLLCIYVHVCKMNRLCSMFFFLPHVHCVAFLLLFSSHFCPVGFIFLKDDRQTQEAVRLSQNDVDVKSLCFRISILHVLNPSDVCVFRFVCLLLLNKCFLNSIFITDKLLNY